MIPNKKVTVVETNTEMSDPSPEGVNISQIF